MTKDFSGVTIRTPARLHFSLIDLNGELGRIDGGIGVALDKPNWVIKITKNPEWSVPSTIDELITRLRERMTIDHSYKIEFDSTLPEHVGLGSQTQLSLAVAHGISILEGQECTIPELAQLVGRGGTSGIGVAAYEHGGFILDGGHAQQDKSKFLPSHYSNAKPAILVNRLEVPRDWYYVVAIPDVGKGRYGAAEVEIFNKHCPIPTQEVEKLSRIILMQLLPALVENNIEHFGTGLNSIQKIGFKSIENQLQHDIVHDLQKFYIDNGAAGIGLSSFGPATFCVIRNILAAEKLAALTEQYLQKQNLTGTVFCTKVNNRGAVIEYF